MKVWAPLTGLHKSGVTQMGIAQRFAMLALFAAAGIQAQNPPGAAAIASKLDNAQVRVYVATLLPHAPVPSRTGHATNRVLLYLDNGAMTRQDGGDTPQKIEFHRGEVRWRPASGAYVAENTGDQPIRILEIDLKGKPAGPRLFQNSIPWWWMRNITRLSLRTISAHPPRSLRCT